MTAVARRLCPGPRCLSWRRYYCQHHRGPFIKDPTSPRFIWRCPIQLTGLLDYWREIAWPPIPGGGPFQEQVYALEQPVPRIIPFFPTPLKGRFSAPSTLWLARFFMAACGSGVGFTSRLAAELLLLGADSGIIVVIMLVCAC